MCDRVGGKNRVLRKGNEVCTTVVVVSQLMAGPRVAVSLFPQYVCVLGKGHCCRLFGLLGDGTEVKMERLGDATKGDHRANELSVIAKLAPSWLANSMPHQTSRLREDSDAGAP
jgi:hypothetical protein